MKHFGTIIIRKSTISKICTALVFTAIIGTVCVTSLRNTECVEVFSGNDSELSKEILERGLPVEGKKKYISELMSNILGFDITKPTSIISKSLGTDQTTYSQNYNTDEIYNIIDSDSTFDNDVDTTTADNIADQQDTTMAADTENQPDTPIEAEPSLPTHDEIVSANGLKLNNATNYDVNLDALCSEALPVSPSQDEPTVLIVHTHTTECFVGDEMAGESERTTDENYNICAVGNIIAETLEAYGIHTIHDTTIHDYPSYKGSYTRELETINNNLAEYPSINVVLDIHRDAYIYNDGSKLRVAANINGEETAQVMLVMGTDSMGLYHPYWKDNLTIAAKIENAAEIMYPGLMRPVNLRRERFNMHVTRGSLLLEVGSNGNTLDEALRGGKYVAQAIAAVLLNG